MLARCGWGSLSTLSKQLSHLRLQESTEFLRRLQRNFSEAAEQVGGLWNLLLSIVAGTEALAENVAVCPYHHDLHYSATGTSQDLLPEDADLSPGDRDFLERPETEFAITQPLAGSCLLERLPVSP